MPPIKEMEITVHPDANKGTNNSPVNSRDGILYVAYINKKRDLCVAQLKDGRKRVRVLAKNMLVNAYHGMPTLQIDGRGHIHVWANMHSTPWQYWRSKHPHRLDAWTFEGQYAGKNPGYSTAKQSGCTGQCAIDWAGNGTAKIPGNQITYVAAASDYLGNLFVACRAAFLPGQNNYHGRQWHLLVLRYDAKKGTWRTRDLVHDPKEVTQGASLAVRPDNSIIVGAVKGDHYTSSAGSNAFLANNRGVLLYLNEDLVNVTGDWPKRGGIRYAGTAVDKKGHPVVVYEGTQETRHMFRWTGSKWNKQSMAPAYAAYKLRIDAQDTYYAFSSGPRMHVSTNKGKSWKTTKIDGAPSGAFVWPDDNAFYFEGTVRLAEMRGDKLRVWRLKDGIPTHKAADSSPTPPPTPPPSDNTPKLEQAVTAAIGRLEAARSDLDAALKTLKGAV